MVFKQTSSKEATVSSRTNAAVEHGMAPAGFRLPAETALGAIRLQVSDLSASLAYYVDVLGFRLSRRSDSTAVLTAQRSDRPLVQLESRPGVVRASRRSTLGLY